MAKAKVIKKTLSLTDVANVLDNLNIISVQDCQVSGRTMVFCSPKRH